MIKAAIIIGGIAAGIVTLMAIALIISWVYNKNGLVEFTKDSMFYKIRYWSNFLRAIPKAEGVDFDHMKALAENMTEKPITLCGAFWTIILNFTFFLVLDTAMLALLLAVSPIILLAWGFANLQEWIGDYRDNKKRTKREERLKILEGLSKKDILPLSKEIIEIAHNAIRFQFTYFNVTLTLKEMQSAIINNLRNGRKPTDCVVSDAIRCLCMSIPEGRKIFKGLNGHLEFSKALKKKTFKADLLYFWDKYQIDAFLGESPKTSNAAWQMVKDVYHQKLCPTIKFKG